MLFVPSNVIDVFLQSLESKNKKKTSPSIKSFFQSTAQEKFDNVSTNNIRKFFLPSPPDKKQELSKPLEKCSKKNSKQEGEDSTASSNVPRKEKKVNLSKKTIPKWSLTLKASKKSKDDESVFEEICEDVCKQNDSLKTKNEIIHCSEEEMGLRKPKKKEKQKNIKVTRDIINVEPIEEISRENEDISLHEDSQSAQNEKQNIEELKPRSNEEDYPALDTKKKSKTSKKGNLHVKTDCSKSNVLETHKKKGNALEILMNKSRNTKINQSENNLEISEVVKAEQDQDHVIDHECSMEVVHCEEGNKQLTKSSTCDTHATNAFDILMMKKSSNEHESSKPESPKSKHKPYPFKLNIRYSKSASESGSNVDVDLDKTNDEYEIPQKTKSKKEKKKKKKADKKLEENQDSSLVDKTTLKSSKRSTEKTSVKNDGGQELPNDFHEDKLTKVKKKKRKVQKSDDLLARDAPMLVQEDSNSSVVELKEKTTKKHNSKSNETSGVLTSPGSEDFEVTPMRKGLRKRTSIVNYANELILIVDKKSKKEEMQKKSKKKSKIKETEKLEDIKEYNKDKKLKKEKNDKGTAETKSEKGTLVNQEKDAPAPKEKRAQGTKKGGVSDPKEKARSSSKETLSSKKKGTSGNKEGDSATKENKSVTIEEKEAPRTKEKGTLGTKKKEIVLIGSDTSPDIEEVKSRQSEKKKSEKAALGKIE